MKYKIEITYERTNAKYGHRDEKIFDAIAQILTGQVPFQIKGELLDGEGDDLHKENTNQEISATTR